MSITQVHYLKDYQTPDFSIEAVHLTFELSETITTVTNEMTLVRHPGKLQAPLVLDGADLKLISVKINDQTVAKKDRILTEESLTLANLPDGLFTLTIVTTCQPHENKSLDGLYVSGGMFCSQCESHGFRKITYYLDRPDVMATFTTKIIADRDKYPVLLSNGNRVEAGELENNRHFVTWQDPFKKPCYLFALVAGKLACRQDQFVTQSGRTVQCEIYTLPQDIQKTAYAMASLKRAMHWDEARFGREYDLDIYMIVAVPDFNMGAMENKGLNIFNTKYILATPETATDRDFEQVEAVIGHEYFHNWTGNRITCRDWFQLSLKEGLTVFRDQEFTSDLHSRPVKRIEDVKIIRTSQFAEDASPMAHPIRPQAYVEMNNFYTVTVYHKGAEVIRMQHTLTGEEGFRRGMDLYFERHDGQAVTCDDFVAAIAKANNLDLSQFMRWYNQAGTPKVAIQARYNPEAYTYTLTLSQTCDPTADGSSKAPFVIPIKLALLNDQGEAMPFQYQQSTKAEHVLVVTESSQTITLRHVPMKPIPSLLRDFSAPVKLEFAYSNNDLAFLMAHDDNAFNRWDAGQTLAQRLILDQAKAYHEGRAFTWEPAFIETFGKLLVDTHVDLAWLAEALLPSSEKALAETMAVIDVDGLHAAYDNLIKTLSQTYQSQLLTLYQTHHHRGDYQLDHTQVAKRKLKNVCLQLLMANPTEQIVEICKTQFYTANNMTDQLAALSALVNYDESTLKSKALNDFYERWQEEALVVDKWFAIQAMANIDTVLEEVIRLSQHPAFIRSNPNKVYALIGSFTQNSFHFHRKDGAGYRFLADQVLALNDNPQVAARMVRSLMSFKRYDKVRQALMKAELERLAHTPKLAKDVMEIVSKSLGS